LEQLHNVRALRGAGERMVIMYCVIWGTRMAQVYVNYVRWMRVWSAGVVQSAKRVVDAHTLPARVACLLNARPVEQVVFSVIMVSFQ